jgi:hypothetical protein
MSIGMPRRIAAITGVVAMGAAIAIAGASPAFASKPVDGAHRVAYCHATHSTTNPFVYIETDKDAVIRAHYKHQDVEDVIPSFWYEWDGELLWFPGQGDTSMIGDGTCEGGSIG